MVDQNYEGEIFYLEFEEGQEYAVLVHVQDKDHEGQDDTYMILARIETNDEGEEEYVPLDEDDENFEVLVNMYEAMGEEE